MAKERTTAPEPRVLSYSGPAPATAAVAIADWLNSREIFAAATLVVLSISIGVFGGTLLFSVLVSMIILAIATGARAIRTGAERNEAAQNSLAVELAQFGEDLRREHEFLGHMATVQDQRALDALMHITRRTANARDNRLLFSVVRRDLRLLAQRLSDLEVSGAYEVWARRAHPDEFDLFRTFVSSLDSGWNLDIACDLRIESSAVRQRAGDVIDTLEEVVGRGVRVRQVFVVPADGWVDSEQLAILMAQWELSRLNSNAETWVLPPPSHDSWAAPGTFAVCVPPNGTDSVVLEMHFSSGEDQAPTEFERLEVVTEAERIGRRVRRFDRSIAAASPLEEFLRAVVPEHMAARVRGADAPKYAVEALRSAQH